MLFLVFQLGSDRYAIEATEVVEVLPLVSSKSIPRALPGVVGVIDYHGTLVPLLDLTELAHGASSRKWMSTRILLVNYKNKSGSIQMLGLLAEHATETMLRTETDFVDAEVKLADTSCLGPVITDAAGIIQRIGIRNLLSERVVNRLFREPAESS
jgi:chemotaxis-related protein WspB